MEQDFGITGNDIDFPVSERSITVNKKKVDGWKAIYRDDIKETLGIVSNEYVLIPHSDVAKTTEACLDAKFGAGNYEKHYDVIGDGIRAYMYYKFKNDIVVKKGDSVENGVRIVNSLNGSTRIRGEFYGMRLVCTNGLTIPGWEIGVARKHLGAIDLEGLEEMLTAFLEKYEVFTDLIMEAENIEVTAEEIPAIVAQTKISKKYQEKALEQLKTDPHKTLWDVYNGLTYVISHSDEEGIKITKNRTFEGTRRRETEVASILTLTPEAIEKAVSEYEPPEEIIEETPEA